MGDDGPGERTPAWRLQRLGPEHAPALLAFERENRAHFAASIPERGDDFFTHFEARHRELLELQADGRNFCHVLVEENGAILGRVNLVNASAGSADLGCRIAERASGLGLATAAVRQVCALGTTEYGLSSACPRRVSRPR
jgi:ribosomal-protein-alanine N-acetyltransferase